MTEHFSSSQSHPFQHGTQHDEINLMALSATLWRGKIWILLCMVFFAVLGGYYALRLAEPKYSATSVIVFSPGETPLLDLESIVSGSSTDTNSLNTEIAIIQARETLEQLVEQLNLTEDPEFNPKLVEDPDAFSLTNTITTFLGLSDAPPVVAPKQEAALTLRQTTENVARVLNVRAERNTYLLKITATSTNPVRAAELANTLGELYIENRQGKTFAATEQAIDWLSERVRELETELRGQEEGIAALQGETNLINRETLERMRVQAKDFRDRLTVRQEDLIEIRSQLAVMQEATTSGDPKKIVEVFGDLTLRRLLQVRQGENASVSPAFNVRVETLLSATDTEIARAEREIEALSASYEALQNEIDAQAKDLQRLEQMERELEVTRDLYQTFLTGLQEVTVQVGLVQTDTSLMSRALPPLVPISPKTKLILAISAFLGGIFASAWLLIRETMNMTIRSSLDLEALSGQKLLGQVPRFPIRRRSDLVGYLRDKPTSPAMEAIRNLRTSLLLLKPDRQPKVIMFTSSIPGEGKTTLAVGLAMNLAGLSKRVLLIEADIRRCTLSKYFSDSDRAPHNNLLRVLEGDVQLSEAVNSNLTEGIHVLLGENTTINAADLLSSESFSKLLEDARTQYDFVIIDTPPVLVVPDARVLAPVVDALLFAVKWDSTPRGQVMEAMRQFEAVDQHVTGLVLTQIDTRKQRRYDYGSRDGGTYGTYGDGYYSKS
ncbi:GumC family protein [Aliiruegeria sabulilitoris]|uniref:GumC family protein n=1 Tax=Aliiruegeria sabulilitoris TaxID=1510458 RepID=UPI0008327630|nr:polysaccharide biosynthesis tyrosine autokinase [Aliiruegeria sabulilitoris]